VGSALSAGGGDDGKPQRSRQIEESISILNFFPPK
jgi:hypothetical protein